MPKPARRRGKNPKPKGDLKKFFRPNGKPTRNSPLWMRIRSSMITSFPVYYNTPVDKFAAEMGDAVRLLNSLKPGVGGPAVIGEDPSIPDYSDVTDAKVEEYNTPLEDVVQECVDLFDGMPHWSHPFTMPNVIPPANKAAIIAATLTNVLGPNIIEGEYAWNVEKAEMESAAMMAKIIGWDESVAGGIYTYGGSGCYLYALKYALTHVLGYDTRMTGIRTDGKILVSQQGHYAKMNSTDWTGLGMNNIVDIETDDDTNVMDLEDLEEKLQMFHEQKVPVISVICTMGTTDAFAVDPVDKVRELVNKYPNPEGYQPPFIYCDAVIGWSWLFFNDYDYENNPLGFDDKILPMIKSNNEKLQTVKYADAVGIDFHKTGWATYNCSLFCMKDLKHFKSLMMRPGSAYLQERTPYNPGLYTLEVSRSGSYALAGWATLRYFGKSGFQSVLGGILEVQDYLRYLIDQEPNMVCVNEEDSGFVTLFRVYKTGVDADTEYENEVSNETYLDQLKENNTYQQQIADIIWEWFRSGKEIGGLYGAYTSYTSGFRTTDYNDDLSSDAVIYALKSFPMNVNITTTTMEKLISVVKIAVRLAEEGKVPSPPDHSDLVCPPYDQAQKAPDSGGKTRVHDLVSGIVGSRAYTRKKKH